jgi:heat shock protein HslJ
MDDMKQNRIAVAVVANTLIMLSACANWDSTDQPDLEGPTWVLTAINKNSPIEGTYPTLKFEGDQVSGIAGCNTYGGSYHFERDAITFSDLFNTEMYCMDPEGVMEQEQTYLELLGNAQRFELIESGLTILVDPEQTLTFETQVSIVAEAQNTEVPEPIPFATFLPPAGFKEYQDPVAGVAVYIPDSWSVTGVIEGQYAIFQSYPEEKYVGGEPREPRDTKCDLNIHPPGERRVDLIQQWESSDLTTIISQREIVLQSGELVTWFELDGMGRANVVIIDINERVVSLTCFGDFTLFDQIADTLRGTK